jgi:hypothetical protein
VGDFSSFSCEGGAAILKSYLAILEDTAHCRVRRVRRFERVIRQGLAYLGRGGTCRTDNAMGVKQTLAFRYRSERQIRDPFLYNSAIFET